MELRYIIEIGPEHQSGQPSTYYITLFDDSGKNIGRSSGWSKPKDAWKQFKMFRDSCVQQTGNEPIVRNLTNYAPEWFNPEAFTTKNETAQQG